MSGLAAVSTLGGFGGVTETNAATLDTNAQCSSPTWHAVETANFKILSFGTQGVSRQTADACESLRDKLITQWLSGDRSSQHAIDSEPSPPPVSCWNPKCAIVLHATGDSYVREVGAGGRSTVASALVDRQQGRIASRRIDVRATHSDWFAKALAHELTHVVLADRFVLQPLPRWVDEGIAILADPAEKQSRHRVDLKNALGKRGEFRVLELLTLDDYPAAHRWGAFYGQSASLVQFLIDQAGEQRFVAFVEAALDHGYDRALKQNYHFGVAELERRWQAIQSLPQAAAHPSTIALPVSLARP